MREQELLKEAERRVQEKVDKLSTQVKSLSLLSAEVQGIVDCTERCVQYCADNEVMSMYTEIRKRIERGMEQYSKPWGTLEPMDEADMGAEVSCMEDLQQGSSQLLILFGHNPDQTAPGLQSTT